MVKNKLSRVTIYPWAKDFWFALDEYYYIIYGDWIYSIGIDSMDIEDYLDSLNEAFVDPEVHEEHYVSNQC